MATKQPAKTRLDAHGKSHKVFHGICYDPHEKHSIAFQNDELDNYYQKENTFCWIDLQSNDINDLYELLKRYDNDLTLHHHFDEPEILPRILERKDSLVFFLYEIVNPERHLDTTHALVPIDFTRMVLILSTNYIITYHKRPLDAVDNVKETAEENFKLAGKTPGFIIFLFLQRCLYDYANLNLANDNYLDHLELSVLKGRQSELARRISIAGLNILTLKKLSTNLHIILMLLVTKMNPYISHEARGYFREMLQNAMYTRQAIDSSRDLLDGIIGSIQAHASSRTREIARILTIVSAIFLPLSLIAGIYGMNFKYIPWSLSDWGFFWIVGGMIGIILFMIYIFYLIDWLGPERDFLDNNPKKNKNGKSSKH